MSSLICEKYAQWFSFFMFCIFLETYLFISDNERSVRSPLMTYVVANTKGENLIVSTEIWYKTVVHY